MKLYFSSVLSSSSILIETASYKDSACPPYSVRETPLQALFIPFNSLVEHKWGKEGTATASVPGGQGAPRGKQFGGRQ